MPTATSKSLWISNRDATPVVGTSADIAGGNLRVAEGYVTTAASAPSGSYYPMVSVPSNCRIDSVKIQSVAQGTGCSANVGVFVPTATTKSLLNLSSTYVAGAAISSAFFASSQSVAALTAITDVTNQSTTNTIALQEQEIWQAIGLASDPGCMLDIGVTLSASAVAGGLIGIKVGYVQ